MLTVLMPWLERVCSWLCVFTLPRFSARGFQCPQVLGTGPTQFVQISRLVCHIILYSFYRRRCQHPNTQYACPFTLGAGLT
jgi:hypothetical protein